MSLYTARVNFTPTTVPDGAIHIIGSATARAALCGFNISSDATPVEQTGEYQVARTSTTGTGAATPTPIKASNFSPAAVCTLAVGTFSVDPTLGDLLFDTSVHQKNTFRWVAYPGREYHSAPAANAGLLIHCIQQSAAFSLNVSAEWLE